MSATQIRQNKPVCKNCGLKRKKLSFFTKARLLVNQLNGSMYSRKRLGDEINKVIGEIDATTKNQDQQDTAVEIQKAMKKITKSLSQYYDISDTKRQDELSEYPYDLQELVQLIDSLQEATSSKFLETQHTQIRKKLSFLEKKIRADSDKPFFLIQGVRYLLEIFINLFKLKKKEDISQEKNTEGQYYATPLPFRHVPNVNSNFNSKSSTP